MFEHNEISNYEKDILAVYIADIVVEILKFQDGYNYCKKYIEICWDWVEQKEIELDELLDCLDSPSGNDLAYYVANEISDKYRIAYDIILQAVSYITTKVMVCENYELPEYLEEIDDEYWEAMIESALKLVEDLEKKIESVLSYFDNNKNIVIQKDKIKKLKL